MSANFSEKILFSCLQILAKSVNMDNLMIGYIVAYEAVKSADLWVDLMITSMAVGLVTRTVARWLYATMLRGTTRCNKNKKHNNGKARQRIKKIKEKN